MTPRTVAYQTPLSTGFSRQQYWSRLPCSPHPIPEVLLNEITCSINTSPSYYHSHHDNNNCYFYFCDTFLPPWHRSDSPVSTCMKLLLYENHFSLLLRIPLSWKPQTFLRHIKISVLKILYMMPCILFLFLCSLSSMRWFLPLRSMSHLEVVIL